MLQTFIIEIIENVNINLFSGYDCLNDFDDSEKAKKPKPERQNRLNQSQDYHGNCRHTTTTQSQESKTDIHTQEFTQ